MDEEKGGIRDFDVIVPKERLARIGGEVVNVAIIPTRVTLELARFADKKDQLGNGDMFDKLITLISSACIGNNPKMTQEFLLDKTSVESLTEFIEFVLSPITDKADSILGRAKNMEAVKPE